MKLRPLGVTPGRLGDDSLRAVPEKLLPRGVLREVWAHRLLVQLGLTPPWTAVFLTALSSLFAFVVLAVAWVLGVITASLLEPNPRVASVALLALLVSSCPIELSSRRGVAVE